MKQCKSCPWKVGCKPAEVIPGYCATKHANLKDTLAPKDGDFGHALLASRDGLRIMTCHYSREGHEIPCSGWASNQLGAGNNIALRIAASRDTRYHNIQVEGPQHPTFQDTLPKRLKRRKKS